MCLNQPLLQLLPRSIYLGVKVVEHGVPQSLQSSEEDRNDWSYAFTPPYTFMSCIEKSTLMDSLGDTFLLFADQLMCIKLFRHAQHSHISEVTSLNPLSGHHQACIPKHTKETHLHNLRERDLLLYIDI